VIPVIKREDGANASLARAMARYLVFSERSIVVQMNHRFQEGGFPSLVRTDNGHHFARHVHIPVSRAEAAISPSPTLSSCIELPTY